VRNVENYLKSVGRKIVRQAKNNLKKGDKVVSGSLLGSIKYKVLKTAEGFTIQFTMADHGKFMDKGVSGTNKRRYFKDINNTRRQSPFRYKNLQPPASALDKWIVRRGIAPRDEKGRFMSRKSLQYLIARKIKSLGIQGISFFTTPVRLALKDMPRELALAFKEDFKDNIAVIK
tara:strand:- start:57 stop:578 length:522 start_codon:yes stop_codon:yes gene_type:complete